VVRGVFDKHERASLKGALQLKVSKVAEFTPPGPYDAEITLSKSLSLPPALGVVENTITGCGGGWAPPPVVVLVVLRLCWWLWSWSCVGGGLVLFQHLEHI